MGRAEQLITENLELWSSAVKAKASAGRGSSKKPEIYGVAKLRGVILDLAVSGLLVQQDPEEEDAVTLLQRIKTEKSELISKKTIKKEKNVLPVDLHEVKNSLPKQWALCRLSDIASVIRGITFPASEKSNTPENGRIACLRTSNIQEEITWEDLLYIRERFMKREDQTILKGDIIMSMANSRELVGKVAIVKSAPEDKITFGGFLAVIRPIIIEPGYLMAFLRSTNTRNKLIKSASQTTNIANISLGKLNPIILPIPPLKEQRRIVAKVDELMALCDQLEQEQENNLETHQTLVSTLLNALTSAAADASRFADAWHRIKDNFDILFNTESSVDQLKQTILQLAVMGKLVAQDLEKEQILDLEVDKIHTSCPEATTPFELPPSWLWQHLNQLADINGGFAFKSGNYNNNGTRVVRISDFDEYGFKSGKIVRHEFSAELEKFRLIEGDILMAMTGGTVGKSFHVKSLDEPMIVNQRVATIRASKAIVSHFLHIVIQSNGVQEEINKAKNSTNDNISMKQIKSFLVPVPPLAEQHRIINKVDELMGLCDQLKASLHSAQDTQLKLAESIVEQAIQSPA